MSRLNRFICALGWHQWVCYEAERLRDTNVWRYSCIYCDSRREATREFFD